MILNPDQLAKQGAYAGAPVKREITYEAGGETYTADVWVRRLSYQSVVGDMRAVTGDGEIAAERIATCIVDEQGAALFKKSDVTGFYDNGEPVLDEMKRPRGGMIASILNALLGAISEVNDLGKTRTAGSPEKTSSGTSSSPAELEDAQ